jgi:hypothetical protein
MYMESETKGTKLQQLKYTFLVYIGVDEAATLGWKKGDKLIKKIVNGSLHVSRDIRYKEAPPGDKGICGQEADAIAEVQPPLVPIDSKVIDSAVKDVVKGLI